MTDTNLIDAVVFPQDDGTGVPDGQESFDSAGSFSLLSRYKGEGTYVGEDEAGNATLQFNDVDTANNEFDIGTGHAYILDSVTIQSGAQTTYDTDLPEDTPYVVVVPNEVTNLSLDSGTNDVWLSVDPTANDSVTVRHGSGLNAPSNPSVKLGTVDASSGDTTRANELANITISSVTTNGEAITSKVVTAVQDGPGSYEHFQLADYADAAAAIQAALDSFTRGAVDLAGWDGNIGSTVTLRQGEYIRAPGPHAGTLTLAHDGDAFQFTNDNNGTQIFGGIVGLEVQGDKTNRTSGSGITSDGDIIDLKFEDLFFDAFPGDCINLTASASRTKIVDSHLENSDGDGIVIGGGSGLKISNNHLATLTVGIDFDGKTSQLVGNRIEDTSSHGVLMRGSNNQYVGGLIKDAGGHGINAAGGNDNVFSGVKILSPADRGVRAASPHNIFDGVSVRETGDEAYAIGNKGVIVTGGEIRGFNGNGSGSPAFDIDADDVRVSDVTVRQDIGGFTGTTLAEINGDNVTFSPDVEDGNNITWSVTVESSATETVINVPELTWADINDAGTRTVLNGLGLNSGDPSSTGQWNNFGWAGVIVRDTTNADTYIYNNGAWSQIASA